MKSSTEIVLAIETAIVGGSISLAENGSEIGNWIGDNSGVAKAENLLGNIHDLLAASKISQKDIDLIAVSAGPGSFTGIRIGIATALGLKTGLGIQMASVSALQALVHHHADISADVFAVLPVGRNAVCIQRFSHCIALDEPKTVSGSELLDLISGHTSADVVVNAHLYDELPADERIKNTGSNIARSVGLLCSMQRDVVTSPLFIAKSF